jgi:hypothetical protein
VYTCQGGFIDIAHARGASDRTAFIAAKILDALQNHETEFSFKLAEPSKYFVQLVRPENWKDFATERETTLHAISRSDSRNTSPTPHVLGMKSLRGSATKAGAFTLSFTLHSHVKTGFRIFLEAISAC